MSGRLEGRRVLVTDAERYIGPPVVELFEKEGAHVIADQSEYADPGAVQEVVEQAEQFVSEIPAGRIGAGEEAAELVLALATDASGFLAGQVIPISGGWVT